MTLSTLQRGGLREWVARRVNNHAPPAVMVDRLRAATGGFPALLGNLTGRSVEDLVADAEQAAGRLVTDPAVALQRFGLGDSRLLAVARVIGGGSFDADARETLVEMLGADGIRAPERGLDVLGTLGVLDQIADATMPSTWQLNPLVARLIAGLGS